MEPVRSGDGQPAPDQQYLGLRQNQLTNNAPGPPQQHGQQHGQQPEPQKKRIIACVRCRQAKLRCDSSQDPCPRCARLDLHCEKDKNYKRIKKRSKIDDLERELEILKGTVGQQHGLHNAPSNASNSMLVTETSPGRTSEGRDVVLTYQYNGPPALMNTGLPSILKPLDPPTYAHRDAAARHEIQSASSRNSFDRGRPLLRPIAQIPRAIGSTALNSHDIDVLFDRYFGFCHPYLPFLDTYKSPDQYYDMSPLLFWTIIGTASRGFLENPNLVAQIPYATTKLAWEVIAEPPLHLGSLQALLLLSFWSKPTLHLLSDTSVSFCNMALSAALQMELQHLESSRSFRQNNDDPRFKEGPLDRPQTSVACVIVAEFMTGNYGVPFNLSAFDWSVNKACEPDNVFNLAEELRHQLIVQKFSYRVTRIMSGNSAHPFGIPSDGERDMLMNMLETEFNAIDNQLRGKCNAYTQMQLYSVMLCLQMYYFFDSTFRESRNAGILKAYNTALSFVSFLSQNLYLLGPYIPTWIIRTLATVCGIHIKVLNSSLAQFVNAAEGVASFQTTTEFLRRCSVGEGDICVRVPNVISQLWQLCQGPLLQHNIEPTMEVQSRLGASMIFEIITLWRKGCKMVKARIDKSSGDVASVQQPVIPPQQQEALLQAQWPDLSMELNYELFQNLDWAQDWNMAEPQ